MIEKAFGAVGAGAPPARRWWALAAIGLGLLAVGLDSTVLSLALPTLAGSFRVSESGLQWFVTSYTLALTAAMLPAGLVGDRLGRRAVLLGSMVLFGLASAGCAFAPSSGAFVVARGVLGIAGAGMIVMALAVITVMFTPQERPRAMGVWAAANFLALPIGPILGGWMLSTFWWGWVFLLNIPVVAVGIIAVTAFIPESRAAHRPRIDWPGIVASSAGLTLAMFGVIEAGRQGWGSAGALAPLLAGLAALAAMVAWERGLARRGGSPLIDLGLFRERTFTAGVLLAGLGVFGLFGLLFLLPQYWQGVLGLGAQGAGFRLLPLIVGMAGGAVLADRLAIRVGARATVALGLALLSGAMAAASTTTLDGSETPLAAWTLVAGFGAGLGLATAASVAIVKLDAEHTGVGTSLVQAIVKLGPAIGATLLGSVLASTYQSRISVSGLPDGLVAAARSSVFSGLQVARQLGSSALAATVRSAFLAGMDGSLRVAAAAVALGVPLALALLPGRAPSGAGLGAQSAHDPASAAR